MLIHAQIFYVSYVKIGIYLIVEIFIEISGKNQYLPESKGFILQFNTMLLLLLLLFDLEMIFEICMDMSYNCVKVLAYI